MKKINFLESKNTKTESNVVNNKKERLLYLAFKNSIEIKDFDKCMYILKKYKLDFNVSYDDNELLIMAIKTKFLKIVPYIIKNKKNKKIKTIRSIIHDLYSYDKNILVQILKEYKLLEIDKHFCKDFIVRQNSLPFFKILIEYQNLKIDDGLFLSVVEKNADKILKYLYKEHYEDFDPMFNNNKAYIIATKYNFINILNLLKRDPRVDKSKTYTSSWYLSYYDKLDLNNFKDKKIDNNTFIEMNSDDSIGVVFHYTQICKVYPNDKWIFNTDGHKTATTKDRINQYSIASIKQKSGVWYINFYGGSDIYEFEDGMYYLDNNVYSKSGKKLKPINK